MNLTDVPGAGKLLLPHLPLTQRPDVNWPLLAIPKTLVDMMLESKDRQGGTFGNLATPTKATAVEEVGGDWGVETLDIESDDQEEFIDAPMHEDESESLDGAGWEIEDDALKAELSEVGTNGRSRAANAAAFVPPTVGMSPWDAWLRNSPLAVDALAAGAIEQAMRLLHSQLGIVRFEPLRKTMLAISSGARVYLNGEPSTSPLLFPLHRNPAEAGLRRGLPAVLTNLPSLLDPLQDAYQATTTGKFAEAVELFRGILHAAPFVVAEKPSDAEEIRQIISIAREYLTGLQMELLRKDIARDESPEKLKRGAELAAYFTFCQLQTVHLVLSLRSALTVHYKLRNMNTASVFARRLLELNPRPDLVQQAKKILTLCEQNPRDEVALDFDEHTPFVVCSASFTPIYQGAGHVKCPYCQASYKPEYSRKLCRICEVSEIAAPASGLRNLIEEGRGSSK